MTVQITANVVLKINYSVWLWHQYSCSSNHYTFHCTYNMYLQYIYCYLLHTHNFLFKVPWRWSCNIFFWSAGKFLPKYMASHSRTRIFPKHQSEPQLSHSYYQFILYICMCIYIYIYIISKLPTSFVAIILNYAYDSNHNIIQSVPGGMCQTSGECSLC